MWSFHFCGDSIHSLKTFIMKNAACVIAFSILMFCCSHISLAQKTETVSSVAVSGLHNNASRHVSRDQVPTKAYRHFIRTYKNVNDEAWELTSTGLVAHFFNDKMQQLVFYNKKGNWQRTVFNYNASKLPNEVRDLVKLNYWGYSITHCSQVEAPSGSVYYITILKNKDFRTLKVQDGEIEVLNKFEFNIGC